MVRRLAIPGRTRASGPATPPRILSGSLSDAGAVRTLDRLGPAWPERLPQEGTAVGDRESRAALLEEVLPGPPCAPAGFEGGEAEGPQGGFGHLHRLVLNRHRTSGVVSRGA